MRKLGAIWWWIVGGIVLAAGSASHSPGTFAAGFIIMVIGCLWLIYA